MTSDTAPPKRTFWQIHLSTALLLTLIASLILFVNIYHEVGEFRGSSTTIGAVSVEYFGKHYGWPAANYSEVIYSSTGNTKFTFHPEEMAVNAAVGIVLCAFAGTVCEYLIRRRSKP